MKVKYLSMMAIASVMGLGLIGACANPCAAKEGADPCAAKTETVDPCAGAADPCAGAADPCAAKEDPCAAKSDPCAAKEDPCAGSN